MGDNSTVAIVDSRSGRMKRGFQWREESEEVFTWSEEKNGYLTKTPEPETQLEDEPGAYLRHSPDGRRLAVSSYLREWVRVLDLESESKCVKYPGAGGPIRFTKQGKSLVVGGIREWKVIDLNSGKTLQSVPVKSAIAALDISPDGQTIVTGDYDGWLQTWDIATGRQLSETSLARGWCPW